MDTTIEPSNFLYSTTASVQPAITWLQQNSVHISIIDKVLGPGAVDEELSRRFGIVLRRQDLWTLNNSEWLNDQVSQSKVSVLCLFFMLQVINFYLKLLAETFNIYVYSTFFYPKLSSCGYSAVVDPWRRYIQ